MADGETGWGRGIDEEADGLDCPVRARVGCVGAEQDIDAGDEGGRVVFGGELDPNTHGAGKPLFVFGGFGVDGGGL